MPGNLKRLARLLPALLAVPLAACDPPRRAGASGPDPGRGRLALQQYACRTCHMIPGIAGSNVYVGPPLAGIGLRRTIAGELPNDSDGMVLWIRFPQRVDPETAMPDMGVTERDARDMAAYLATLK